MSGRLDLQARPTKENIGGRFAVIIVLCSVISPLADGKLSAVSIQQSAVGIQPRIELPMTALIADRADC
jgi:uncharacterized membrane protein (DUF441 family)